MKKLKAFLVAASLTALSIIPVLADITGIATTTTTTTTITEVEYMIGDIDNSGSIDLTDAQLTLKAALKITTLNGPAAKAADVNSDGFIDLTDAQIILKLALRIMSIDNLYVKPDYLDMFITAMNSKNLYIADKEEPNFLALYSYSPEITNEQLLGLAQNYHGIRVATIEDLHNQGLLSIPADKPLTWDYKLLHGVLIQFGGAEENNRQITISWGYTYGATHGKGFVSTFEIKNGKWVLIDTKMTVVS